MGLGRITASALRKSLPWAVTIWLAAVVVYIGHVAINGAEKPSRDRLQLSSDVENSSKGSTNDDERLDGDIKGILDSRMLYWESR